jgi:hypothetical protein
MSSNSSSIVISFSIAILLLLTLLLLISYNSKCKMDNIERFENDNYIPDAAAVKNLIKQDYFNNQAASFTPSMPSNSPSSKYQDKFADPNSTARGNLGHLQANDPLQEQTSTEGKLLSSEQFVGNISNDPEDNGMSCFVKDRLTSSDLLPKNVDNSRWADINPSGSGMLGDQNFLTAGYHVGINTIGQSLRNANLQLRSEPPNPQVAVSPWGISTIEPDVRAVAFEIGSAPSF